MARILTRPFDSAVIVENPHITLDAHLRSAGITPHRVSDAKDDAALIDAIRGSSAQVLFKRSQVRVTEEVLAACPSLHAVQLCCIGSDSVDMAAAARHGVMVFNDPASNARSVVELAIGHLIALSRRLYETNIRAHEHAWEKNNVGRYEVLGKKLGIVGMGNIGRQVARAATALGMRVRFFDSRPVAQEVGEEMGWERCEDLGSLFRGSDCVSVHTSALDAWGKSNESFLNDYLGLLGADRPENSPRIFVNLARGNVYSSQALLDAVAKGAIRKAAVDVYPSEPRPGGQPWENPYAAEPRIVCTPHIGAATQEAQPRIAGRVARTIVDFSRFGRVRDCVFAPRFRLPIPDVRPGNAVLAVVHSTARGTHKAVSDAVYSSGANSLGSAHRDFDVGLAYDVSVLDRPMSTERLQSLVAESEALAGVSGAVMTVRQMVAN